MIREDALNKFNTFFLQVVSASDAAINVTFVNVFPLYLFHLANTFKRYFSKDQSRVQL